MVLVAAAAAARVVRRLGCETRTASGEGAASSSISTSLSTCGIGVGVFGRVLLQTPVVKFRWGDCPLHVVTKAKLVSHTQLDVGTVCKPGNA